MARPAVFILTQCYHHGSTSHDQSLKHEIFLNGNEIFLIRNYTGATVFHVPCIATQAVLSILGSSTQTAEARLFAQESSSQKLSSTHSVYGELNLIPV